MLVIERSHLNASALLLEGRSAEARSAVYEHVKYWPKDVLIAQMVQAFLD